MKTKQIILLIILLSAISCSDNSTNPTEEFNYLEYLPLDSNNYWYYDYFQLDNTGNRLLNANKFDSTTVVDSNMYLGRKAVDLSMNLNELGKLTTTEFSYSTDSNKIALYGVRLQLNDSVTIKLNDWLTVYDRFISPWKHNAIVLNDTVINGAKFEGIIRFNGFFLENTKIELDGKLYKTFITKLNIDFDVVQKVDTFEIDLKHREEFEYRFAKDIGLIVEEYRNYKDSTLLNGYEKIITKYKKEK